MRTEARQQREVNAEYVHGYHHGSHAQNYVFASDRPQKADENYHLLSDGTLPAMYGLEVETECWGITNSTIYANVLKSICFQNFHKDLFKIESDCTLNGGNVGAECITQPMTKAYIRNQYRNFKAMYEWFEQMGVSCSRSGNCGMHIHISLTAFGRSKETQDEAIRKLYYIVNHHFNLMCALLYRDRSRTSWCGKMDEYIAKTMNLNRMDGSHSNCFNGSHYRNGNIELRLVGGQKNFPCFRNTMESVFHLMEAVKKLSWKDLDDVTKIFSGCNQYVFNRLKTYVFDAHGITREQLLAIEQTVKTESLL